MVEVSSKRPCDVQVQVYVSVPSALSSILNEGLFVSSYILFFSAKEEISVNWDFARELGISEISMKWHLARGLSIYLRDIYEVALDEGTRCLSPSYL